VRLFEREKHIVPCCAELAGKAALERRPPAAGAAQYNDRAGSKRLSQHLPTIRARTHFELSLDLSSSNDGSKMPFRRTIPVRPALQVNPVMNLRHNDPYPGA